MQWYYVKDGTQAGPVDQSTLAAMVRYGEVKPDDLVWRDGMGEWQPAAAIPELVSPAASTHAAGSTSAASPYAPPRSQVSAGPSQMGRDQPTYLWQAIVVTLLCCLPLGIPAIVFASQAGSHKQRGDHEMAAQAAARARTWCWWSFGAGLVFAVLYGFLVASGHGAELE